MCSVNTLQSNVMWVHIEYNIEHILSMYQTFQLSAALLLASLS
jgi:hypothetical protein